MNQDELLALAAQLSDQASQGEEIEVAISRATSTSVRVHDQQIESLTDSVSDGVGVRVISENRQGFASSSSLSPEVLEFTLSAARQNAASAEADPDMAVVDKSEPPSFEVDHWDPSILEIPVEDKINFTIDLERRALAADELVVGARTTSYTDGYYYSALSSSKGTRVAERSTFNSAGIQVLASDGQETKSGYGYDGSVKRGEIDVEKIIEQSAGRAVQMIGADQPGSQSVDLFLDPDAASDFFELVASMLNGESVIKGRTPFADRVGQKIASDGVSLLDNPHDPNSSGATGYDGEGQATKPVNLISGGKLDGFLHDSYSARRGGFTPTSSAVRSTRGLPSPGTLALAVGQGSTSPEELMSTVANGVMVFGFSGMHSGVNLVSGDMSVGLEGRLIRNGQIAEPISECTITSTIQKMLLSIDGIGNDLTHLWGAASTPSIVIRDLALSGK